jgi:hypothetical protein
VANHIERAVNDVRIAALSRKIAKVYTPALPLDLGLQPALGSPVALVVVLIGYALVALLVSL